MKGYFNDAFFKQNNINETRNVFDFNRLVSFLNLSSFNSDIKLDESYFDSNGNRNPYDYEKKGLRGGKEYEGPIGWTGYGLSVYGKYDNGDNTWLGINGNKGEWCVAYYGTRISNAKSIIINGLKKGLIQSCMHDEDLNHPGNKVGIGVYVTPKIYIAEMYNQSVEGYKCVFMCRVNPKSMRIPRLSPDYWVVNDDSNDIRPYRLLIKKE